METTNERAVPAGTGDGSKVDPCEKKIGAQDNPQADETQGGLLANRRRLPNKRRHEVFQFEHERIGYVAGAGRYPDGSLAEIFLDCPKSGSAAETAARDGAVAVSLALQFGASIETVRKALTRWPDGRAAGPVGHALDLIGDANG